MLFALLLTALAAPPPDGEARLREAAGEVFAFETSGLLQGSKLLEGEWGVPVALEHHAPPDDDPHDAEPWPGRHAWPGARVRMPAPGARPSRRGVERLVRQVNAAPDACVRFEVRPMGPGFAIVPRERREHGTWQPVVPVLDAAITVPADRAAFVRADQVDLAGLLAHALTRAGHATAATEPFWVDDAVLTAGTRPARAFLEEASVALGGRMGWKLVWHDSGSYLLRPHRLDGFAVGEPSRELLRSGALEPRRRKRG